MIPAMTATTVAMIPMGCRWYGGPHRGGGGPCGGGPHCGAVPAWGGATLLVLFRGVRSCVGLLS